MAKPRLNEIIFSNFKWTNIVHPTELETVQLKQLFDFSDLDLKAVLPPIQRPKMEVHENYIFMILLYPVYDRQARKIHAVEVDFFIGTDFLVTTVSEEYHPLIELFSVFKHSKKKEENKTPAGLLYEILKSLEAHCLPMSVHLSNDIDQIENEVFTATDKQKTINEVLLIKTNIVNFRKALNRHTHTIQHFSSKVARFFPDFPGELFKELVEETEDLWSMLENYQDTINAIHESHLSLLNFRSNKTMQLFTVFTSIIFTLELIISLVSLGMDSSLAVNGQMTELAVVFGALGLVGLIMLFFFRRKNWI